MRREERERCAGAGGASLNPSSLLLTVSGDNTLIEAAPYTCSRYAETAGWPSGHMMSAGGVHQPAGPYWPGAWGA